MNTYPSSAFRRNWSRITFARKIFFRVSSASEISKDARPERHGHIERSNSTLGNKSGLARVVSGQLSTGKQICWRGLLVSFLSRPSRDHCFHRPIKISTGRVHFNKIPHILGDFSFQCIDQVQAPNISEDIDRPLITKEAYWSAQLFSLAPYGLNKRKEFHSKNRICYN